MQGAELLILPRLIESESISPKELKKYKLNKIITLINRIYYLDIDHTLILRYKLLSKILRNPKAALFYTLSSINLNLLYKFFINNKIEDIVLIPNKNIIINSINGKYLSRAIASHDLVEGFLRIASAKGLKLLRDNPSFRYGLNLGPLKLRVSIDLPPIVSAPHVYIRIHRKIFTIFDLIKNDFLSENIYKKIKNDILNKRKNLIVTGPPGSGKTTLLRAIDLDLPEWWQRVYIDEADEFPDLKNYNQIKINTVDKLKHVFSSLNRNIDIFILGELQYPEHFEAFKRAQELGIQTMATMHSDTIEGAIKRLENYKIDYDNIIIIQTEKTYDKIIKRYIKQIYVR